MGHYRINDLFLAPSLVSLLRLPLAVAFVLLAPKPLPSVLLMLAAALTDVVDGAIARRFGLATPTGAVVDGVLDKLFTMVVVATLLLEQLLLLSQAALLFVRELLELPLVLWWALHRKQRRARAEDPKANHAGKLATVLQFLAITWLLWQGSLPVSLLVIVALAGGLAAVLYWKRELGAAKV